jgi:carboxyl-terminal processing protease
MSRAAFLFAVVFGLACNSAPAPKPPADASRAPVEALPKQADPAEELKLVDIPRADPREPRLGAAMKQLLERGHVRPHAIDDSIATRAFALYVEHLDPGKLILLKQQVAALERDATKLDDQLRSGDFRLARVAAALLARERKQVAQQVAEVLAAPLDFTVDEAVETDPEKLEYAASEDERRDRWRKNLKQQVLERIDRMEETAKAAEKAAKTKAGKENPKAVVEPPPPTFEGREKKAREELARSYAGRFSRLTKADPLEAAELFINSVTGVYDPHTLYLAPEQQEDFDIQISGSLEGIGAVLSEDDHYISVREVVPGGAAWREGQLEAGDLIMAVKQATAEAVDVADMRINEVVRMIRGPKGSVVTLTIKKPDERVLLIPITRDLVVVEDAYARGALLRLGGAKQPSFGYVYLPSFYGNTRGGRGQSSGREATGDVRALLAQFAKSKLSGVVIDLRGNGGGLLNHATDITGLLVDEGPVVAARSSDGELQVLSDEESGVAFDGHVLVLVDRFSASASEILAGALQDYGRALIVGTGPTHGKGTVQAMIDLDRVSGPLPGQPLGVAKLTVQQFFLVDGESTQWRGVTPDIVLPDPAAHVESGERYLDNAIPWSSIAALKAAPWHRHDWDVAQLAEKSRARQAAQPVFATIAARSDYVVARRKETLMPLKREAWIALRDKDREALEKLDAKLDEGPERFSVKLVDYRPVAPEPAAPARESSQKRVDKWKETLARDPWVEEALHLLGEMGQSPAASNAK